MDLFCYPLDMSWNHKWDIWCYPLHCMEFKVSFIRRVYPEQHSRAQRGKAASELGPKGRGGVARVCNLFWAPIKCSPFFGRRS